MKRPLMVEALENRRMLTVLPNSTALPSNLATLTKTATGVSSEITAIHNKVFAATSNLPLVGSTIANASGGVTDTLKAIGTTIFNILNTSAGTITGTSLQNEFSAALGPSGADILPNTNLSVVLIDTTNGSSGVPNQVDINLEITGNLFTASLPAAFNLGLPGVGLNVNGSLAAAATYDVKLDLVLNSSGFYIDLSPTPDASLTLSVTAPGLSATGTLGFFELTATDGTPGANNTTQHTALTGTIGLNLNVGGSTPTQLTPSRVGNLLANSSLSASANAQVHLATTLSFGGNTDFPTLSTALDINWNLANASLSADSNGKVGVMSSVFGQKPDIQFNNIELGLGTFFTNFLDPIVAKVQAALAPVQPLINILNAPAPIFNDLHLDDLNGDGKTTILEVLESFLNASSPDSVKFLNAVLDINTLINSIPANAGNIMLPLGNFEVGGGTMSSSTSDVRGTPLSATAMTSTNPMNTMSELSSDGSSNSSNGISSFITALDAPDLQGGSGKGDGAGFQIPLLTNPTMVFDLLLGQNVDLFTFDTPTLNFNPSISFSVAPIDFLPFLKVQFTGSADFTAHLAMGYDTYGLTEFALNQFKPSDAGELLDGFYVVDDPTQTYAQASLTLSVGLGLDIVVASAYVTGGITGTVTFNVDDGNAAIDGGKLRASVIADDIATNPLSLFNISGTVTASFDLKGQYIGIPYDYNIATIQLASFDIVPGSIPGVPSLGTVSNGLLTLNVPNGNQNITVNHVSNDVDGTETVSVTSGGITQNYPEVNRITGVCGTGNDTISVSANSPVTLTAGSGNETFLIGPNENATLNGGTGNDYLGSINGPYSPSTGSLMVYGGGGNDTLNGGGGSDNLNAFGYGNTIIYGGGGTDTLTAGGGNDTLYGGANTGTTDETMIGGPGNATFIADNSTDSYGLGGPQYLQGGQGTNLFEYDTNDFVPSYGAYDTEIQDGITIVKNGQAVPNPTRASYVTIAAPPTVTYTGSSEASLVQADCSAFDKLTNQQLVAGPIELTFYNSLGQTTPVDSGTYTFDAYYLGDSTHAASPVVTGTLVINPVTPTINHANTLVSFDGQPHAGNVTATGPAGQNLTSDLQLSYQTGGGALTVALPTQVGTYTVFASVSGNRDYNAIVNQSTGSTVTISTIFNVPTAVESDNGLVGSLLADVNGDGIPDLITEDLTVTSQVNAVFNVYLGKGNGAFNAPMSTSIPITNGSYPVLSDGSLQHLGFVAKINGSANPPDLFCAVFPESASVNSYGYDQINFNSNGSLQNGVGFSAAPQAFDLAFADFNGDGKIDLVADNYASYIPTPTYLNSLTVILNGIGASTVTVGEAPLGVATGDFNGDGKQDLIVSDEGGTGIMLGNGNGTFGAETYFSHSYTSQIAVADFNHDGKPDVMLSDASGIYLWLGNGNGTFNSSITVVSNPAGSAVDPIILGDFNGDGTTDLATYSLTTSNPFNSSSFQVYYGNGNGTFAAPLTYATPTAALLAGDLNVDGVTDLIDIDGSGDVNVLLNTKPTLAATIAVTGTTATFDGNTHAAIVTATGLNNVNLGPQLTITYLNTVTDAVLTSAPTQGGIYDVLVAFAGGSGYNAIPVYNSLQQVVINPAPITLSFAGTSVQADGSSRSITASATGLLGENLTSLLQLQYQNEANGTISTSAPSQPGTYEVSATFQGNANYQYVPLFDAGRTVVITAKQPGTGAVILSDGFTNSGGAYSTAAYVSGATINGNQPDTVDLPGGTYTYYVSTSTYAGGIIATGVGNAGSSFEVGPQSALSLPINGSSGAYSEPGMLTLSADLEIGSIAGTTVAFRGITLGVDSAAVSSVASNGNPVNNGVLIYAPNGNLSLVGSNGTSITNVSGGTYNASILGPYSTTQFYHLSYTLNMSTGAITNLTLSDAEGTETIAAAGTLPGFVTGTGSASSTANYVVVSSSAASGAAFGYVDNLTVYSGSVPVATPPPTVTTGSPTSISTTGATLNGTVNAQGSSTTVSIQYSTTPTFAPTVQTTLATGFTALNGVAVDSAGNAYIVEFSAGIVEKITPNGTVTQIASGLNGPASATVDSAGDVFVAEFFGGDVKEILPSGAVRTVAGGFSSPQGVAVDKAGDVYVGESGAVIEVLPNGTTKAISSGFSNPTGLALDAAGNLYIADSGTNSVYEVLTNGTKLTLATGFNRDQNLAIDGAGDVYVADYNNNAVKEILPGGTVVPVGSGFSNPIGVAVDAAGDLLVAANGTGQLLKLSPVSLPTISSISGSTAMPVSASLTGLNPNTQYYYRVVGQSAAGIVAGSTGSFYTLQTGKYAPGTVILDDDFNNSGVSPYANGNLIAGNKADIADLPGSTYSFFATEPYYPGGSIATGVGNSGAAATVGPQSNIVASLQSTGGYTEPSVLTLSVDLEMNTIAGSDELSRGIGLGLNASVPNSFPNNLNPINNGVLVNAANGNLYFTSANGGTITLVPGGTYNASLLGTFSANRFYTLTFTVNSATGALTNLSLSDSTGAETIAAPGTLSGFVTGTGTANSTANYVDISSNGNSGGAFGYVDNLIVSVGSAPTVTSSAPTTITSTGATISGTVNAQGSSTTNLFQYTSDPAFTPTVSTNIGSGFLRPKGVAVDADGNVFVADTLNNAVKEILINGTVLSIGSGFSSPYAVAVNAAGDVFVADFGNNALKEILPGGAVITIGSGFSGPGGVAVDSSGDVFVSDSGHNAVKEILPSGTIVTIGSGFNNPQGLAVDSLGDLFVTDYGNSLIKEVLPGGTILTLGSSFSGPVGVAVDAFGDVFVADTGNNAVKEIQPGGAILTLGSGFSLPIGVAVDSVGDVFVGDYANNRVVELSPPTVTANPGTSTGSTTTSITAAPTPLANHTAYYYRAIAEGTGGTSAGVTDGFILAPTAVSGITPVVPSAPLSIGAGASFTLGTAAATSDRTLLALNALTLTGNGVLNLGGNDLLVHNTGTLTPAQSLANITAELQSGYNGGTWTGPGIDSTAAATNSQHLTALGVMLVTTAGTFDGQSVTTTDVVVKYTYYGDANLDGKVDGSDYSKIDSGFLNHLAGWANGDFNYDGVINGSDYSLIDNAYNTQGAKITASIAAPGASIARFSNVAVSFQDPSTESSNYWLTADRRKQKHLLAW